MRNICLFVTLLSFYFNYAQKIIKKSIVDPGTTLIQIDATNCFQIDISTADMYEVVVEAIIDGEYKKDLLLNMQKEGSTLKIGTGFQPNFKYPNDKLSAHKIVSIALNIVLPIHQRVQIFGTNCNIKASGNYKELDVTLDDGYCHLNTISEMVSIKTQSGEIEVRSSKGSFEVSSKYGKIHKDEISIGDNLFILTSTTGNINIKKPD